MSDCYLRFRGSLRKGVDWISLGISQRKSPYSDLFPFSMPYTLKDRSFRTCVHS